MVVSAKFYFAPCSCGFSFTVIQNSIKLEFPKKPKLEIIYFNLKLITQTTDRISRKKPVSYSKNPTVSPEGSASPELWRKKEVGVTKT